MECFKSCFQRNIKKREVLPVLGPGLQDFSNSLTCTDPILTHKSMKMSVNPLCKGDTKNTREHVSEKNVKV